jgi:acetylornithine deacetylase/succinyl-diaminopimelate desuccinylase-like protein
MRARAYIKQLMGEAGLAVREDTMGSIFGVLAGANPGAAAVGTGSHCDAIPLAGMYDGTVGGSPARGPLLPRSLARVLRYKQSSDVVNVTAAAAAAM